MADLHITWVDLIVALVVVASMGFAIYRGFVRETLSMFSWAAAAFATLYFGRYVVPLMTPHFSPLMADVMAYSAVFVLVLLPLSFIGHRVSQSVQGSPVGPVDRSLGAAFGVLRGLAVVAMLYIVYSLIVPVHAQKGWITSARSLPLIQTSAKVLLSLLPSNQSEFVQKRTGKPTTDTVDAASKTAPKPKEAPKTKVVETRPAKHVKHVVRAAQTAHHSKKAHVVKLAHAATETESPAATTEKTDSAPAHPAAATPKKPARKGYGADDRRALNRLIESTGNGGGK
jgi:membrane protein required for colicin V production